MPLPVPSLRGKWSRIYPEAPANPFRTRRKTCATLCEPSIRSDPAMSFVDLIPPIPVRPELIKFAYSVFGSNAPAVLAGVLGLLVAVSVLALAVRLRADSRHRGLEEKRAELRRRGSS